METEHYKILLNTVKKRAYQPQDIDDLKSVCYVAYIQKFLPNKAIVKNEFSFLKVIFQRACIDYYTQEERQTRFLEYCDYPTEETYEMDLETAIVNKEFLDSLSTKDLEWLQMLYNEESYSDIAKTKGLASSSMKNMINKFRKRLQEQSNIHLIKN